MNILSIPADAEDVRGIDAHRERVRMYRTAMSDLQVVFDDLIASGDKVVTRWTARGTNDGELMGMPPTGKRVEITGMSIDRFDADEHDSGPIVLINQFSVAPEDADELVEVWADDAAFMRQQPGFVSTQLHRGTAGSTTFVNVAVWESSRALGRAFGSPEFQRRAARYPDSTVAAPHVFEKVAVPGICDA